MVDAAFDGATNVGGHGCVYLRDICGRDGDRSAGHFVEEGFPGVCFVSLVSVRGLDDGVVRREAIVQVYDTADDGEVVFDLGLQEAIDSCGEEVFREFWWFVPVDFRCVGVDGALIFRRDGFAEGAFTGLLYLGLRHGWVVVRKGWVKEKFLNSINSVEFMLTSYFSGQSALVN